ncbi:MAG: magnesium-dependent phosphatase-1 [Bacteroidales bacterium]
MKDYLFVFDLDFTIWECGDTWCDHSVPPYIKKGNKIFDDNDTEMKLYPDIIHILEELFHSGAGIAIASRTTEPSWAEDLLTMHKIAPYFHHKEIYPGSKLTHFRTLHMKTRIPYEKMIFFDDEPRNIHEVSKLGVNCVLVPEGLSYERYKASSIQVIARELV